VGFPLDGTVRALVNEAKKSGMDREKTIDALWERSSHGTERADIIAAYEAGAAAEREAIEQALGTSTWIQCTSKMPAPTDSGSGYFWCYDGHSVELLEAYGYESDELPATGFCHEASGIVRGVTHWMPAHPPVRPNV
jgi:hypothetical protein